MSLRRFWYHHLLLYLSCCHLLLVLAVGKLLEQFALQLQERPL
jgi:hypothetical protein